MPMPSSIIPLDIVMLGYDWVFCLHVCLLITSCLVPARTRRMSQVLELKLQIVVSYYVDSGVL